MTTNTDLNWIANYIWGIADDVLRDLYVRGKYRDVILPMTVLRRLDAVLEDSKQAVLDMKDTLDNAGVIEQDATGGIEAFLQREVLPYAPDAWYQPDSVRIGYEISFTRYFYKPQPMRTLAEIRADILELEKETEGLLGEILGESQRPAAI